METRDGRVYMQCKQGLGKINVVGTRIGDDKERKNDSGHKNEVTRRQWEQKERLINALG